MNAWPLACLFITVAVTALVAWPIAAHPTLPRRKKLLLIALVFLVLVPGALTLYFIVGMPELANAAALQSAPMML